MMRRSLQRWGWWVAAAVLMAGSGYTAGYLLSPPENTAVSRTLPDLQPELPQPMNPRFEPVNEA